MGVSVDEIPDRVGDDVSVMADWFSRHGRPDRPSHVRACPFVMAGSDRPSLLLLQRLGRVGACCSESLPEDRCKGDDEGYDDAGYVYDPDVVDLVSI